MTAVRFALQRLVAKAAKGALLLAFALVSWMPLAHADGVEYAYDENGRLTIVYAPSGDAAQYVYDPAGNITAINRFTAGTVNAIDFQPKSGPVGTQVTIRGTGFSTTPSQNSVSFNGTPATVLSSAANKLIVTVPSGATTGPITVTVGTASATTSRSFTVTGVSTSNCASLVTGYTPNVGTAGTAVTISGAGFDYAPTSNSVLFNRSVATISSSTASSITTSVPAGATSGHLLVTVPPSCPATNAGDFFVPPTPYTASDLGVTGRLTYNGAPTSFTLAANKKALYVFDGTINNGATVVISGSTIPSATIEIRDPDGNVIRSQSVGASATLTPLYLAMTGGYSIFVNPANGAAGSATIQVGAPDLVITNAAVGTIVTNQNGTYNIPVSATVTNGGAITTTSPISNAWYDYAYLSTSGYLDAATPTAGSTFHVTAVAPGANYNWAATITTPPAMLPGNYTLFLKTDGSANGADKGGVIEASEFNNVSLGIPVTLPPWPDLSVSASVGSIVENISGSYNIPVTFTVFNAGGAAQPSWNDYLYLSANGALDASSIVLGSKLRNTSLGAGAGYTVSQTFTTSSTVAPGAYTLYVKADDNGTGSSTYPGAVKEGNEANNSATVNITLPAYPDLAISNASVGTIVENAGGSYNVSVSYTVTNNSSTPAQPSWWDYNYISSTGTLTSTTPVLGRQLRTTALAGNSSYNVSTTYTTAGLGPGNYSLFMKADSSGVGTDSGAVKEGDKSNNTTSAIQITLPPYPDLGLSNPAVNSVVRNSNGTYNVTMSWTVTNLGTTFAQGAWWDYVFASTTNSLSPGVASPASTLHVGGLAGGASYNVNQTYTFPSSYSGGTYYMFIQASSSGPVYAGQPGSLVESNYGNNVSQGIFLSFP